MSKFLVFLLLIAVIAMGTRCDYGVDTEQPDTTTTVDTYHNVPAGAELATIQGAMTTEALLPFSGSKTISIPVYPGGNNILIMRSLTAGTWSFKTWGSPIMGGCGGTAVFTSWKDESKPNNTWNYWPGGGQVCWPTSFFTTKLNSGSQKIAYQFDYKQYNNYGQTVYAKFTKL